MASWQSRAVRLALRAAVRGRTASHPAHYAPTDLVLTRRTFVVAATEPKLRGEWILASGEPRDRAIVFLHGGAYTHGSPLRSRRLTVALARTTEIPVFALDYRLAPEHRFPAALEDALAAFEALRERMPASGIALVGESSGGGLALATALEIIARARNRSNFPAAVVAYSPWTDLLGTGLSLVQNARRDDTLTTTDLHEAALDYVDAAQRRDPRVSPLYGDLRALPPTLVFASANEILRDDAVRFADRARHLGAPVELVIESDLPHAWPAFAGLIPEAQRALSHTERFLHGVWADPVR